MIIFVDMETTGLDPVRDRVLEIAAIVTDEKFVEVGRYHIVTDQARHLLLDEVNPFVLKMHLSSGLWAESIAAPSTRQRYAAGAYHRVGERGNVGNGEIGRAEDGLMTLIDETCGPDVTRHNGRAPTLAGSSVGFDHGFAAVWLPLFHARIPYRLLDVSSVGEFARRFAPAIHAARPRQVETAAHRAIADIEYSLALARYYGASIGDVTAAEARGRKLAAWNK